MSQQRIDQWEMVITVAIHAEKAILERGEGCRYSPYTIAQVLDHIARIARTLHHRYERACNEDVGLDPSECAHERLRCEGRYRKDRCPRCRFYRVTAAKEARVVALGAELGCFVETQRDPRGAAVKLYSEEGDNDRGLGGRACLGAFS